LLGNQRVAGEGELGPDNRGDVAGAQLVDVVLAIREHLQDAPDALFLAIRLIEEHVALTDAPRIHAHIHQLAHKAVDLHLEGQRNELTLGVGGDVHHTLAVAVMRLRRQRLQRGGQVVGNGVQQGLHAGVL